MPSTETTTTTTTTTPSTDGYQCGECGKRYAANKYLQAHIRAMHRDRLGGSSLPYVSMTEADLDVEQQISEDFRNSFLAATEHDESRFYVYVLADASLLPADMTKMGKPELVTALARAIFYVGKGSKERIYHHMRQAMAIILGRCEHGGRPSGPPGQQCWSEEHSVAAEACVTALHRAGVVPLIVDNFLTEDEAYAREDLLIKRIGLTNLVNDVGGVSKHHIGRTTPRERQILTDGMLWRAMLMVRHRMYKVMTKESLRRPEGASYGWNANANKRSRGS